jgi:hypothetical protein
MTNKILKFPEFNDVFSAEFNEIRKRREKNIPDIVPADVQDPVPAVAHGFMGLALSGGGVRSAAFSLGVLQGLQTKKVIDRVDYLSTVSGGGYIGTAMSVGMSANGGVFPFGKTGTEPGETPETRHLRDNSRYLLQNGLPSAISALAIYLRGIVMNSVILLPFLLIGSAILIAFNPDTARLVSNKFVFDNLGTFAGNTAMPFTIAGTAILLILWVVYAIAVSINPIALLKKRRMLAQVAAAILFLFGVVFVIELHIWLLRAVFEYENQIKTAAPETGQPAKAQIFEALFALMKNFVIWIGPLVVVVLPFIKNLATGATADASGGWADLAKRLGSRAVLIFAAAIVPLALWLVMMQLAYWGTAVSTCSETAFVRECKAAVTVDNWSHAPEFLQSFLARAELLGWATSIGSRYRYDTLL